MTALEIIIATAIGLSFLFAVMMSVSDMTHIYKINKRADKDEY